jgi:hypothetical protein
MDLKPFYKSKTIIFAVLVAVFGVLQTNIPMFQEVLSPTVYGLLFTGIGVVVAALRAITTTSVVVKAVVDTTQNTDQ